MAEFISPSSFLCALGGSDTPLLARRDWVLRRIGVACGLQTLASEDSASASRGREGSRDEVARQRYKMLTECQRGRPHKCLRIRVLRRGWQRSPPGARNNFHSACDVYLVSYAPPPSFRSLFAIYKRTSCRFAKIRDELLLVVVVFLSHTHPQREWNARS
jgi:hypothetical protein